MSSSTTDSNILNINSDDAASTISKYKKNQKVLYTSSSQNGNDSTSVATIMDIHFDDDLEPFYTISLQPSGKEKQTDDAHLSMLISTEEDEKEKNSRPPPEQISNEESYETSSTASPPLSSAVPSGNIKRNEQQPVLDSTEIPCLSNDGPDGQTVVTEKSGVNQQDTDNSLPTEEEEEEEEEEETCFYDEPPLSLENSDSATNKMDDDNNNSKEEEKEEYFYDEPNAQDACHDDVHACDKETANRTTRRESPLLLDTRTERGESGEEEPDEWYDEEKVILTPSTEQDGIMNDSYVRNRRWWSVLLPMNYYPALSTATTKSSYNGAEYYKSDISRGSIWKNFLICFLLIGIILLLIFYFIRDGDGRKYDAAADDGPIPTLILPTSPSVTQLPSVLSIKNSSTKPSLGPTLSSLPSNVPTPIPSLSFVPSTRFSLVPSLSTAPSNRPSTTPSLSSDLTIESSPKPSTTSIPTTKLLSSAIPSLSTAPTTKSSAKPSTTQSPTTTMKPSRMQSSSLAPSVSSSLMQVGLDVEGSGSDDRFGSVVSLSSDGMLVAVGAPLSNGNGRNSGLVRVYRYDPRSENWGQEGNDILGAFMNDNFGSSVSLSGDGSIVAVGAPKSSGNGFSSGGVWVYKFDVDKWILLGQKLFGKAWFDNFGVSVSLSTNGDILAVGARGSSDNGISTGYVRVYGYSEDTSSWSNLGNNMGGEFWFDKSGWSISLSGNGSFLAVGAPFNGFLDFGHARVYQFVSDDWSQLGIDIDGKYSFQRSGWSVSITNEVMVAVGDASEFQPGQVRVYSYSETTGAWNQIGQPIDSLDVCAEMSVALSNDGTIVAVGCSTNKSEFVSVYKYNGAVQIWEEIVKNDFLSGTTVSLSRDGRVIAVGHPLFDGSNGSNSGRIKVFQLV